MALTRINFKQTFFVDRPLELVRSGELSATAFRYETGVCGLRVANESCSMVVLPYMGMQVWDVEFCGKRLSQKSMFDMPLTTTKFGDNYGGFLYHCGLNNVNFPEEGDTPYALHDVLPFAVFEDTYVECGEDDDGPYLAVGGTFVYRNSQELHWAYSPELRLLEGSTIVEMSAEVENRRHAPLEYVWLCHMNWLGVDGSTLKNSVPVDDEHVQVAITELGDDSPRAVAVREWGRRVAADPALCDVLDSATQCYDPEMCVNYRYEADGEGWGHALQVMPDGDACYVGFDTSRAPFGMRWFCRTGDEDGVGICLPSTGTNRGTAYERAQGHFNTLGPGEWDLLLWRFGYLDADAAAKMGAHIDKIVAG